MNQVIASVEVMRNHQARLALIQYNPIAAVFLQGPSRFERMAQELQYAIQNTSRDDMAALLGHIARDGGAALSRRVAGLWDIAIKVLGGTADELKGMISAIDEERFVEHLARRTGTGITITTDALASGIKSLSTLTGELKANPSDAVPRLMFLVLASVAASGGPDGNGGLPDLDIPLMGIGAHRSPFTHSIIIGSMLETALLLFMRVVMCAHKNLPKGHDPLWNAIAGQSVNILNAAGKGASIGIAYHLMVDAVAQPGPYHGLYFDMPIEGHQFIMGINVVGEATATKEYPDEERITETPAVKAAHQEYRRKKMHLPDVLAELLNPNDRAILLKYGAWLQALVKGDIKPTTLEQVAFLKVARGLHPPKTVHEMAWMELETAKKEIGWKMQLSD